MKQILTILIITAICSKANAQFSRDTLEIKDTAIHFIKIGDKLFEIKRLITLEAVKPPDQMFGNPNIDGIIIKPACCGSGTTSLSTQGALPPYITLIDN